MKRLFLISLAVMFLWVPQAFAKDVTMDLTFEWEQTSTDMPNLLEWRLKWADTETGTYIPVVGGDGNPIKIPYDGTPQPVYTATEPFVVVAPSGTTVTKYFKLTAVSKDNEESALSAVALNEDGSTGIDFTAPWDPVGTPVKFNVKAKVVTP
jgi:hypothetical protein